MLKKRKKATIIRGSQKHDSDTGSSPVQLAVLNARIESLSGHLKKNRKDHSSRRGLLKLVSRRRKHEKYLAKTGVATKVV